MELNPCSICGGRAVAWVSHVDYRAWIACDGPCGILVTVGLEGAVHEAVQRWNAPASEPAAEATTDG